jgi:hypothetical protein
MTFRPAARKGAVSRVATIRPARRTYGCTPLNYGRIVKRNDRWQVIQGKLLFWEEEKDCSVPAPEQIFDWFKLPADTAILDEDW